MRYVREHGKHSFLNAFSARKVLNDGVCVFWGAKHAFTEKK